MAELDLTQMRNDIDVEVARAVGKEKAIEFELNNTADKLNEEISDRISADDSLRSAIDNLLVGASDIRSGVWTLRALSSGASDTSWFYFGEKFDTEPFAIAFRIRGEEAANRDVDISSPPYYGCGLDVKVVQCRDDRIKLGVTNNNSFDLQAGINIKWLAFTHDTGSRNIEIADARLGYDGISYDTIGNAIRRQIGNAFDLSSKMQNNMISFEEFYDIAIPVKYGETINPRNLNDVRAYEEGQYAVIQVKPGDVYKISAAAEVDGMTTYGALWNEENEFVSDFFFNSGDPAKPVKTMDGIITIPETPEGINKMVLNGSNEKPISVQKLINNEKNIAFWEDIEDMHRRIEELERKIADLS